MNTLKTYVYYDKYSPGKRKILVKKEEPSLAMEPDSVAIYLLPFLRLPLLQEIEPLMCWIRYVCMRSVRISQFGLEGSEFDSSLNVTVFYEWEP